jgi:activator of HSP90 ATPase
MQRALLSRRSVTVALAALPLSSVIRAGAGWAAENTNDPSTAADGLSRSCESIYQERQFGARPAEVYEALTDATKFDALTRLSDAVTLVTAPNAKGTSISAAVGGAFVLFGGYITGRHLEMKPGVRLVQAWRAGSWKAGDYSVVNFSLAAEGTGCRLTFYHRGFPEGQGASLAYGWRVHYWEPLAKLLQRS